VLGISTGCLVHVSLGALGISVLLMMSANAFHWLKWAGAAYLVFLGARMLFGAQSSSATPDRTPPAIPMRTMFMQGALTNVLNPKVALFFLAFVPQFIDADAPSFGLAFAALGMVFVVNGTLVSVAFAWLAARAGRQLRVSRHLVWLNRMMGISFVALGIRLALIERQ
jgi:threonine/homoserine/homoserine lactone efflux protein